MKKKVYWIKGWPNNGIGKVLFKLPFLKVYVVKDVTGKIVVCTWVEDLKETIEKKKKSIQNLGYHEEMSWDLKSIYFQNEREIKTGKEYLLTP